MPELRMRARSLHVYYATGHVWRQWYSSYCRALLWSIYVCGISPFPMPIPGHWIGRALFSPHLKNSGGQSRFSDFCVVEGRGRGGVALNPWATAATAAVKILSSVSQSGSLSHSPSSSTSALRQIYVLYDIESMASTAFYLPLK